MVFAVQAAVAFRNTARRDSVLTNVQTRLAQMVPWGETTARTYTTQEGDPAFTVTVRFFTRAEQDSFWADIQAQLGTGVNGPVTGSKIWRHDCPHDQGQGSCAIGEQVLF